MKKNVLFLFILFHSVGFGQNKNYIIDWETSKTLRYGLETIKVPAFQNEYFSYDFSKGVEFITQWPVSTPIDESSLNIIEVTYQNITAKELLDVDVSLIKTSLEARIKNSKARNKRLVYFSFNPIIKSENGLYKRVTGISIDYNVKSTNSNSISSKLPFKTFKSSKTIRNSVLTNGDWYKFYIDTTGVFRLSKNFIQSLGVDVNTVDPRTIKIYGNGGKMIPFANAVPQPFDITENAVKFIGEEDGVFDNEDYIIFYGVGPKAFDEVSNTNINIYTDKTFYYLNVSPNQGKRIKPLIEPNGGVDLVLNTFQDYKFHEQDIHNIGTVGRRWFGERFNIDNQQTFNFNFPDLVTSEPVMLRVFAASVSSSNTQMDILLNNNILRTLNFGTINSTVIGSAASYTQSINVTTSNIDITLNYNNTGNPSSIGYLDYISIEATRALNFNNKQFRFRNNQVSNALGIGEYIISNASQLSEVWDVTDIFNVNNKQNSQALNDFSFKVNLGQDRVYVAVSPSDFFEPRIDAQRTVTNQNLKGTIFNNQSGIFQDIDYLIIAPNNMLNQAERLANINRKQYNLNVKAIGLNEIYSEFSTGNQDIGAIRNLVKYVYDNASAPENRMRYLCLLGDGSYDYKDRIPNNTNIIPSWHSLLSFNLTNAFISDDFYGMMDEDEGSMANSDGLDIAIGRILADTPQRANELIDKIELYYTKESIGRWRNNYVVVSDDVDLEWEGIIQETTDNIGDEVTQEKPFINVIKIHADAFQQETSSGGERYPEAVEAISNAIDNGALVVNYFGHGGEDGLAAERLLDIPGIDNFNNICKLNCFVTVTCEFTKFDNPFRQTAGEFTYWNKNAGAISLITTTRQVFVTFGITFNNVLGQYLFSFSDNDTFSDFEYPTTAEALRLAKTDPRIRFNGQKRLVFYIGDPAMQLAFPDPNIKLTMLNDVPILQATDTLKALSKVKLSGEIADVDGNRITTYNGTVSATLYDKFVNRQTLANDGTINNGEVVRLNFQELGAILFRGQASVTNGAFNFEFVIPKDVGIPIGAGRISFYAKDNALTQDQSGADVASLKIGGLNENAETDNTGPVISLFMNDENFVSGGITNESPTLVAKLEDPNGINTASGIGHDIVAILDGDETNPFVLNEFYETEIDNFQKGNISFPLRSLEPGLHTITLKAWDVYNNSSTSEIEFTVFDENEDLVINNVLNYPNPFVNYTEFWFNHNSSQPLDVSIQIFTVSGKLVRTLNGQTSAGQKATTSSLSKDIVWDGRDDFGDRIGKGVYVYKLIVKSQALNKTVEKIEKLVIL